MSDHSPCTVDMKELERGDFSTAWGGISSLQLKLPVMWTAARRRGHTLADVVAWMADGPARLAGLDRKGPIEVGRDADFCVFAPDVNFTVDATRLFHRHPVTPYAGKILDDVVCQTVLRGEPVDLDQPHGRLLTREAAWMASTPPAARA